MVEIRCSDRAFASAMTVLVDVLDDTFPGFDEMHEDVSIVQLIFPGDDLTRFASMVRCNHDSNQDSFFNGTWNTYIFSRTIRGVLDYHQRVIMMRVQPDIVEKPFFAIQKLLLAIGFPQSKCVLPECPCNGAGTMLDYWAFMKDKPVTSKTTTDVLNGIAAEWKRRVDMVAPEK